MSRLSARMRNNSRECPYLYSLHFKLVDAVQEDKLDEAAILLETIAKLDPAAADLLVTDLRPNVFPWDVGAVSEYFNAEEAIIYRYGAPDDIEVPDRQDQVAAALHLLKTAAPELRSEFDELITAIIFAKRQQIDGADTSGGFGGASALRAFGGFLLNVETEPTVVDCAASLIHEQAHNLLFALSPMEGVVSNSENERFSSPLRDDARPMEGIFHATFVLARMAYSMAQLRKSGQLSSADDQAACLVQDDCVPLFFDGLKTVREHGQLTPQGAMAMEAAEDYMAAYD